MKILHYTLGFPPARSGGLVGYAIDLMTEQKKLGNTIIAMFPGKYDIFNKKMRFVKSKFLNFDVVELVNSLPLPIFGGIKTPSDFMKPVSPKIFVDFLKETRPDVIHIHTLMGLPKEFFLAAKELNIKLVFTTHDYFGLSPNPTFFYEGKSYDSENSDYYWKLASTNALSTRKLRIFQLKCYPLIRFLGNRIKSLKSENDEYRNFSSNPVAEEEYSKLRDYYISILMLIDKIHFNSTLAKDVYSKNINDLIRKNNQVISLTNRECSDVKNKLYTKEKNKPLHIGYIGPDKYFKGFYEFVKLSKILGRNYQYHTYGYSVKKKISGIIQHGRYSKNQLSNIYQNIDILIVPSIWKETFGLVVLEALANQTIVFVSDNVGAKDLVESNYIFNNIEDVANKIKENVYESARYRIKSMKKHATELLDFYA